MLSVSTIDQRRMMQARIDALFAGKISTEAFLRSRKSDEEPNIVSNRRDTGAATCGDHAEAGKTLP